MYRQELLANSILLFPVIIVLSMAVVVVYPVNLAAITLLYLTGLIDLIYAKLPLFRRRIYFSFGPRHIPRQRRRSYFRGYRRIGLGMALNVLALAAYSMMAAV